MKFMSNADFSPNPTPPPLTTVHCSKNKKIKTKRFLLAVTIHRLKLNICIK
uniref:Uncharacterized protein n=1 Tax=Oryza brachyantha TaxID=4533 RepID=J3LQQ3_ORYBR